VTRDEWLSGTDPLEMVNAVAPRLTDRKLRLFLAACCRRLYRLPTGPRWRDAVETAERFADGECGQEEMKRAARAAHEAVDLADPWAPWSWLTKAGGAVFAACLPPGHLGNPVGSFAGRYMRGSYLVMRGVDAAAEAAANHASPPAEGNRGAIHSGILVRERTEQCRLLRDVAGDPFRPAALDPSWLAWNSGTVVSIAGAAYEKQAFDCLPILADALEDAGCTDPAILGHLRGPGPHVRGCFVIDLILDKG
jgi:hypothetical protein